jgi:hypothetical protein
MNRTVAETADGAHVFRAGRHYRMLVLVAGETDRGNLSACLVGCGFGGGSVGMTLPGDWPQEKAPDWPDEGMYALLPAQSLVRVSAAFAGRAGAAAARVENETEIEPGATMRILEAWDAGEAHVEPARTGAAAASSAPSTPAERQDKGRKILLGAGAIAAVALGWNWLSGKAKLEREQERFEKLTDRAEREEITKRVHELVAGGMHRGEALERATEEADRINDDGEELDAGGGGGGRRVIVLRV